MSGSRSMKKRMLEKSIEAYILALETINRLSVAYRIEAFSYLICNAWELLLKARILDTAPSYHAIYKKRKQGQARETITLDQALVRLFLNANDPVRRNIERISQFRNDSAHHIINHVPKDLLTTFQSGVLNYHNRLGEWFGLSLSDRVSAGMMTIVYDFTPEQFDMDHPALRKAHGKETALYLSELQASIRREHEELGRSTEFSIDLSYKLVLTKKQSEGDISLLSGPGGAPMGVVEVAKDSGKTHPFRQTELKDYINERFNGEHTITNFDIQCISKVHAIENRPDFFYQSSIANAQKQYSIPFADWILKQRGRDPDFFTKVRGKARSMTAPSRPSALRSQGARKS